jgi:hypothetical protein
MSHLNMSQDLLTKIIEARNAKTSHHWQLAEGMTRIVSVA